MLHEGQLVQLDKIAQERKGPLPERYWLRGRLFEAPQLNRTIRVLRSSRAAQTPDEVEPVEVAGLYISTPVQEMTENEDGSVLCRTMNSFWLVTPLPETDIPATLPLTVGINTA